MEASETPLPLTEAWRTDPARLQSLFAAASPFPHLVMDDFLEAELAEGLADEFPSIDAMPKSRDYVFGNKHELSSVEAGGPSCTRFRDLVLSPSFAAFLAAATSFDVFVDPAFYGGGFHQGGPGSFLDFHVDFNIHPLHSDWRRRLNILLYLNRGWQEAWGGHLLIKGSPTETPTAIAPLFNRAVIMLTDDRTYHGYRKISFPPGVTRKSLATYGYERVQADQLRSRTTGWVPEDAGAAKRLLARNYNMLVKTKNRFFGSGTAKNR
jgi:Rps23 Pro-64 3,4-dihydroxylase Tpa1-like proline 4-hydroxylase